MRFLFLTGFLAFALGVATIGCNDNEETNAGTSSGTLPGEDGGSSSGSSSGFSSSGGGGGGTFWYISRRTQLVGISDLSGADVWSELVDEGQLSALTIGAGSAWVLTKEGNLRRYDLTTHELVTIASVAKNPHYMTFAAGAVWVTDDNDDSACADIDNGPTKLLRVDPASNQVVARIPITATDDFPCNRFNGLGTDGTLVYPLIHNNFGITVVDPATNTVTKRAALGATSGGYGAGYLAVGSGALWVHDTNAKTLLAIDPSTLAVKTTTPLTADYLGEQMVASATAVVMDKPGETVLRVDVADPTKQEEKTLADAPDAFILHDGTLYATVRHDLSANLLTLDQTTLAESKRTPLPPLSSIDELVFVP